MNINKITNLNFNAHFKDDNKYWQLRESMFNLGITYQQINDCDEFLQSIPDAEIVIDAIDEDDYKNYIFGNVITPKGKSEKFLFEDYKTTDFIYMFRDVLADTVRRVTK